MYGKQLLAFRWQSKRGKVEVLLTKVMEGDVPQGWSGFPAEAESTPEKVAEGWIGVTRPKIYKVGRGSPDVAMIVTRTQEAGIRYGNWPMAKPQTVSTKWWSYDKLLQNANMLTKSSINSVHPLMQP